MGYLVSPYGAFNQRINVTYGAHVTTAADFEVSITFRFLLGL